RRGVARPEQLADRRVDAREALAYGLDLGRVQRIWYMFAVGPPRSLIVPLKAGSAAMVCTSARTERGLRLWMTRPSCIMMEQKVQPPKQPRMICTESLIIAWAGIGSA